jgi:signal transduction histidine kinase/CheY-like chemotaxis protein/HPt (histidine-containing phosphotransfer) domain-containing protein
MNDAKFVIDNDWTRNWEASIAVKITAVVIWALVVAGVVISAITLHGAADRLDIQDTRNEEAAATRLQGWYKTNYAGTPESARNALEKLAAEYGFAALRVVEGDMEWAAGSMDAAFEARPSRTIHFEDATGGMHSATLVLYQRPIAARVAEQRANFMIGVLVALLVFAVFLTWVTNHIVAAPFQKVVETMRRVTNGDLGLRLSVDRKDEYGHLAEFFNSMLNSINDKQHELTAALQAAERADKAKSTFLANMSHEMRTPLTAVLGFAETLLDPKLNKDDHDANVRTIMRTGGHLLNVINDVLDLGKIEADRLILEKTQVSPFQLMSELRTSMELQARAKNINFEINYEYPIPTAIESDALRLKQILLNLCGNAVKFTPHGTVAVNVRCDVDKDTMTFEVIDTGIGMSEEQLSRIFYDFTQADSSITKKFGGTGLGLSISRRLAAMLDGELTVSSKLNVGSRFKLTVGTGPLTHVALVRRADQQPETIRARDPSADRPRLEGHVLLAEDSVDNQNLITFLLRQIGVTAIAVENGRLAVAAAQRETFDLILMDMQMPELDGLQATQQLRRLGFTAPIVAVTANAFREDRDRCVAAGCNEVITKPIDVPRFHDVLSRFLAPARDAQRRAPPPAGKPAHSAADMNNTDPEFQELIRIFLDNLPNRLAAIETPLRAKDWAGVKAAAHVLKGIGGSYGFTNVTSLAAQFEAAALKADANGCEELMARMHALVREIRAQRVESNAPRAETQ